MENRRLGCNTRTVLRAALLNCLIPMALGGLLGALSAHAQTPPTERPGFVQKDSKISSIMRVLRDEVPQHTGPIDSNQRKDIGLAIRSHQFSKPISDAINARRMRISAQAEVQTYVEVDELNPSSIQAIQSLGVRIEIAGDSHGDASNGRVYTAVPTLQVEIPLESIDQVEGLPFVRFVRLPDYGKSSTGAVTSQGDHLLQADAVRARTGMNVDGTGINVGVISSGIGGIFAGPGCTTCGPVANTPTTPSPIILGNLPASTGTRTNGILTSVSPVLPLTPGNGSFTAMKSYTSNGDLEDTAAGSGGAEGSALLEVVHDLAPGANLNFANYGSGLEFEQAVDALAATNDVVVDDALFNTPSYDGNSDISINLANALNNNANTIRAYITSAGNYALDHYAGTFTSSGMDGTLYTGEPGALHLFTGVPYGGPAQPDTNLPPFQTIDREALGSEPFDPIVVLPVGETAEVNLSWNDKVGASSNDYDLFLVPLTGCTTTSISLPAGSTCKIGGPAVASSENPQTGTQDPFESVSYTNNTAGPITLGIAIENVGNSASPVVFDMFIPGYLAKYTTPNHNFNTISGSVPVPGDSLGSPVSVITVGAINQDQCSSPDNCTGLLEGFSSQGPTQITPVNGTAYTKPNLVAVDEVCITGAGGFGNTNTNNVSCPVAAPYSFTPKLFGGDFSRRTTCGRDCCAHSGNDPLSLVCQRRADGGNGTSDTL